MPKYYVAIDVIYTDEVEAKDKDEAIERAIASCPFDNDDSVEPHVEQLEEGDEDDK